MINFKIFSQIPRLIYGNGSLKRISELMHTKQNCVLIYDSVFEASPQVNFLKKLIDGIFISFNATESEPSTYKIDEMVKQIKMNLEIFYQIYNWFRE